MIHALIFITIFIALSRGLVMAEKQQSSRAHFASRIGFTMAAAGSAVGLGNIWKFPYITGENGGGAFVLVYLLCVAVIGIPLMIAEFYIGATAQSNIVKAFAVIHKKNSPWQLVGWLAIFSTTIILSFYSVVGGWILDFLFLSAGDQFSGRSDVEIAQYLSLLFASPLRQSLWHLVFMVMIVGIVAKGINKGIERWNIMLMPALLVILIVLVIRALFLPGLAQSLNFLFAPDFSRLTPAGVLEAVGHSFFTLSIGMGIMLTYGSYLAKRENLVGTAIKIAILDTMVALFVGIVMFAIIFTYDLSPDSGPTLMFRTLPTLFVKMPGGYLVSVGFFLLVAFAALTSAVSVFEVIVSYAVETSKKSRLLVSVSLGVIIYFIGLLSAFSSSILADVKINGLTFFEFFDLITTSISLPIGALAVSLFAGWVVGPKMIPEFSRGLERRWIWLLILWTTRVIAPLAITVIFINGLRSW